MDLIEAVKAAGVVGVDEAGFPTRMKFLTRAECFMANGMGREPLTRTDKYLMRTFPDRIVQVVGAAAAHVGIKRTMIALRKEYVREAAALRQAIATFGAQVELFEIPSFYPAGDKQVLIQQACDTSIPKHGIPPDMGAVVGSMGTLLSTHDVLQGISVTEKYLSVVGEMERPVMHKIPLGTPLQGCIDGARPRLQDYTAIVGSPMTGRVVTDPVKIGRLAVTGTTGNLIALSNEHYLARRAALPLGRIKTQAKSVCAQRRMCTSLCPRYLIGYQTQPHLMMRNLFREELTSDDDEHEKAFGQAVNCCDRGVCEMFSCPMGLSLRRVNAYLKDRLCERGIQVPRNLSLKTRGGPLHGRVSADCLMARLGFSEYYYQHAGDDCAKLFPEQIWISFRQHIGGPVAPAVQVEETAQKGDLLVSAAQGLSANIHTSISGIITEINEDNASIRRDREAWG